jgi:regulatory protein
VAGRDAGPTAFGVALALLTGRALTSGELSARLRRRGFDAAAIAAARLRLADLGMLDDRRTAAAWADAARHRGLGPRRVRDGLAKRLLPRDVVDEAAAGAFPSGEEEPLAREVLERWERAKGRATDAERRRAAYAHLRRRGFSNSAARTALFNRPEIE